MDLRTILPLLLSMQQGKNNNELTDLLLQTIQSRNNNTQSSPFADNGNSSSMSNGFNPMMLMLLTTMMNGQNKMNNPQRSESNIHTPNQPDSFGRFEKTIDNERSYSTAPLSDKQPDFSKIQDLGGNEVLETLKILTDKSIP